MVARFPPLGVVAAPRPPPVGTLPAKPTLRGASASPSAAGGMAALTGKTLSEMGYTKVHNVGGIGDWIKAGGETES